MLLFSLQKGVVKKTNPKTPNRKEEPNQARARPPSCPTKFPVCN